RPSSPSGRNVAGIRSTTGRRSLSAGGRPRVRGGSRSGIGRADLAGSQLREAILDYLLRWPAEEGDPVGLERSGVSGIGVKADLPPVDPADLLSRYCPAHSLVPVRLDRRVDRRLGRPQPGARIRIRARNRVDTDLAQHYALSHGQGMGTQPALPRLRQLAHSCGVGELETGVG